MAMKPAKKPVVKAKVVAKPKASTTAKPKTTNLKKGGLAPGSKQVEIMQAQRNLRKQREEVDLKDIVGKGKSAKATQELDKLRKSVGWKPSQKLSNRMYDGSMMDTKAMKARADRRNKKK
jgi:hypothetical protein